MPEFEVAAVGRRSQLSSGRSGLPASVHIPLCCGRRHSGRGDRPVGEPRGVSSFPQVLIDRWMHPVAWFAALTFVGLEGGGVGFLGTVSMPWVVSDLAIPRSIFAAAVLRISSVTWA